MTLQDVVRSIPLTREDMLRAAGLQTRQRAGIGPTHVGAFGLGLAIGAAVALLYAPKPGSELRRQLADRFEGALDGEHDAEAARRETH